MAQPSPDMSPARRRAWIVSATLAVTVAALSLAFVVWRAATVPVRHQVVSFAIESDAAATIDFDVSMAPGAVALCHVSALSASFAQVGYAEVRVGPETERVTRVSERIATQERAVAVDVDGCEQAE